MRFASMRAGGKITIPLASRTTSQGPSQPIFNKRLRLLVLGNFRGRADLDGRTEALVIFVTDGHAHVNAAAAELESIVGVSVGREPIVALDIFAKGFETRVKMFRVFLFDIRNGFSVRLDNSHIFLVHPNAPLEIALILLDLLWADVKNVGVDFIELLLTDIFYVVLGKLVGGQNKRLNVLQVFLVLLIEADTLKGG